MLTGWTFAQEGKKATQFDCVCKALGVQFDLREASEGILMIRNTEARPKDLVQQILDALEKGNLDKHETLSLHGRIGFADGYLHGRAGKLVLKHFVDHAYGPTRRLDPC